MTVAILGIMAGVAGLALGSATPVRAADEVTAQIAAARRDALRQRHPVSISVRVDGRVHRVTAMPDGRIVGGEAVGGNRLTGAFHEVR